MERNLSEKRQELAQVLFGEENRKQNVEWPNHTSDSSKKFEGGWIHHVEYLSRPIPTLRTGEDGNLIVGHRKEKIPGFVLEPNKKNGKAIVAVHQHALQYDLGGNEPAGLEGDQNMHYGLELAQRGFYVLAPDALPFGQRFNDECYRRLNRGEEQYANQEANLNGHSFLGRHVLDAMAAVDILDYLDFNNIGMIGHSLGGLTTAFTTALDTRIKVGVVSCGFCSYDDLNNQKIMHSMVVAAPGELRRKFVDMYSLLELLEDRHIFISAGTEDHNFPLAGVERMIHLAKKNYPLDDDQLILKPFAGKHEFPGSVRQEAYAFLEKFLR